MKKWEKIQKIEMTGYGHWKITITYRNKPLSAIITDSVTIDKFNSNEDERGWKTAGNNLYDQVVRRHSKIVR